jgi:hypothetical protein
MRSENSQSAEAVHERQALFHAAEAVAETNWPRIEVDNWSGRLLAGRARLEDDGETAKIYLSMIDGPDRKAAILSDASAHLRAAGALIEAAKEASLALNPTDTDVAVVETAIGNLRAARNVYVASLKALLRDRAADPGDIKTLKQAFDEQMEDLGKVADLLAVRLDAERARSFAAGRGVTGQ